MITIMLIKRLSICTALLAATWAHAGAQPKFSITPVSSNTVSVSAHSTAPVSYKITNNLPEALPLVLDLASLGSSGITQVVTGVNPCSTPIFRLGAGESCILNLSINGASFGRPGAAVSFAGPEICIYSGGQGNFSCSQPSFGHGLNVIVTV